MELFELVQAYFRSRAEQTSTPLWMVGPMLIFAVALVARAQLQQRRKQAEDAAKFGDLSESFPAPGAPALHVGTVGDPEPSARGGQASGRAHLFLHTDTTGPQAQSEVLICVRHGEDPRVVLTLGLPPSLLSQPKLLHQAGRQMRGLARSFSAAALERREDLWLVLPELAMLLGVFTAVMLVPRAPVLGLPSSLGAWRVIGLKEQELELLRSGVGARVLSRLAALEQRLMLPTRNDPARGAVTLPEDLSSVLLKQRPLRLNHSFVALEQGGGQGWGRRSTPTVVLGLHPHDLASLRWSADERLRSPVLLVLPRHPYAERALSWPSGASPFIEDLRPVGAIAGTFLQLDVWSEGMRRGRILEDGFAVDLPQDTWEEVLNAIVGFRPLLVSLGDALALEVRPLLVHYNSPGGWSIRTSRCIPGLRGGVLSAEPAELLPNPVSGGQVVFHRVIPLSPLPSSPEGVASLFGLVKKWEEQVNQALVPVGTHKGLSWLLNVEVQASGALAWRIYSRAPLDPRIGEPLLEALHHTHVGSKELHGMRMEILVEVGAASQIAEA